MLGIDIGGYSVKAAVVKKTGKRAVIEQFACEVLPVESRGGTIDAVSLQNIINKLIKRVGKGQNAVALSIPTSSAILKSINLDKGLSGDALEGEVQLQLINFVPFPPDQVYVDFVSLGEAKQNPEQQEIFVAASRRDIVDKVANAVNAKTIKEKAVDIEVFAIGQIVEQVRGKGYQEAVAVIDIGYKKTTICVFKEEQMLFSREQQVGGHHLTEAIAEATGISLEEAEEIKHKKADSISMPVLENYLDFLCEQVMMALDFFKSSNEVPIDVVYVTGGGSSVPRLFESFRENIPDYKFERLPIGKDKEIQVGKKNNGLSPDEVAKLAAVSAGLSMRK